MLKQLKISNFTAFGKATFDFSPGINVIVGANGTGKTHVLKLGYLFARAWPELKRTGFDLAQNRAEAYFEAKLMGLFRPGRLAHLLRRGSAGGGEIAADLDELSIGLEHRLRGAQENRSWRFGLVNNSGDAIRLEVRHLPDTDALDWAQEPVFVPSKEIVSLFEGLIALFEKYEIQLDETYRDLAVAMSIPERRKPSALLPDLLARLSEIIGGELVLEKGRLILRQSEGTHMEPHLLAEGFRKLGMLLYLVRNQIIEPGGTLFWDEPEANLNPELMRSFTEVLVGLAAKGVQVILATHSLFVMREIEILMGDPRFTGLNTRFIALAPHEDGVRVSSGDRPEEIDPIAALDADLEQSGRYMETE